MWQLTASMSLDATSRNTQFVHDAHISFIAKSYADSRNLEREKPAPLLRFVDPVFKQVGGGQIYALIAKCIGYLEEIP